MARVARAWTLSGACWVAASAVSFWSFGFTMMLASDLWWHLAAGRFIWEHAAWPRTDAWSFTAAGRPWLLHEGLASVIFHAWASAFGRESLVWWKWGVLVAAFLLLFLLLWRHTGEALAAYLAALLAIAVGAPFFDLRPQLYTVLGYVGLLSLVLLRAPRWSLPLLFAVWVNLHGGFVFGLVALGILLATEIEDRRTAWRAGAVALVAAAACLLNPTGLDAFRPTFEYAFDKSSPFRTLDEWRSPFQPGGIRSWLYVPSIGVFLVAAVGGFALKLYRDSRVWTAGVALGGATLAMSLQHRRIVPLFAISTSLALAPVLARLIQALPAMVRTASRSVAVPAVVLALGIVWLAPYPLRSSHAFHYLTSEFSFPVEALRFVEVNRLRGDVFALYNWGGYVHLRTAGALRVFIDGRADRVFAPETYRAYVRVLGRAPGWRDIVEGSGAQYVLWPRWLPAHTAELEGSGRWRVLYYDDTAVLLIGAAVPAPSTESPPDSAYRQVALGTYAYESGALDVAETHFARALDLMPYLAPACEALARVLAKRGDAERARETARRCVAMFPDPDRRAALRDAIAVTGARP